MKNQIDDDNEQMSINKLSLVQDLTEKIVEYELKERLLQFGLNQSTQPLVILDLHGVILYTNIELSEMFGYKVSEMIGKYIGILDVDPMESCSIIQKIVEVGMWKGKIKQKKKDGTEFYVHMNAKLISDGKEDAIGIFETRTEIE